MVFWLTGDQKIQKLNSKLHGCGCSCWGLVGGAAGSIFFLHCHFHPVRVFMFKLGLLQTAQNWFLLFKKIRTDDPCLLIGVCNLFAFKCNY